MPEKSSFYVENFCFYQYEMESQYAILTDPSTLLQSYAARALVLSWHRSLGLHPRFLVRI
jgi:hypothetical protein